MARYLVKRFFMIIAIVLIVTLLLFILMYTIPGSYINRMPIHRDGDTLDRIYEALNAGDNLITKFIRYCYNIVFHFDFGSSVTTGRFLATELATGTRITLIILVCSAVVMLAIGVPLGVLAAVKKNRFSDRVISVVSLLFASIPCYVVAYVVAFVIVLKMSLLPMVNTNPTPTVYIMPTIVIAIGGVALIIRLTRASMLEVLQEQFIIALRSKGLNERVIIYRHALKNAITPIIAVLGGFLSQLLFGSFVVENFYNMRGLGSHLLESFGRRDLNKLLGSTVIMTVIIAVINIVCDTAYAIISPQIRQRYSTRIKPEKRQRDELRLEKKV